MTALKKAESKLKKEGWRIHARGQISEDTFIFVTQYLQKEWKPKWSKKHYDVQIVRASDNARKVLECVGHFSCRSDAWDKLRQIWRKQGCQYEPPTYNGTKDDHQPTPLPDLLEQ